MQGKSSLYLHLPFCEKKCFYCSFTVSVGQLHRRDDYLQCLGQEADRYAEDEICSVYFGGGTPSLLTEEQLERLVAMVHAKFSVEKDAEWTIEANPEDITWDKARLLRSLGITRISLGAQSFHDGYLKYLGRCHDAQQIHKAYGFLRKAGWDNINLDLMYAFPEQTVAELEADVDALLALQSEHVSLYTLTIDPHSRFFVRKIEETDGGCQAEQYSRVTELLGGAGYRQYEVSNFSRRGKESRHNLHYWCGGNYIGLGVGAHSHCDGQRWWNVSRLPDYLQRIRTENHAREDGEELNAHQRLTETFLIGLRMTEGVDRRQLQERYGCSLTPEQDRTIDNFIKEGWLVREGNRIKASRSGLLVLDQLCARLI